jgi:hypothetical protein
MNVPTNVRQAAVRYIPTSKDSKPIRFENLRPGSYYRIFAEPSRGIRTSNDQRFYRKDFNGFFSINLATGEGVVLMPNDLVVPFRRDNGSK